MVLKGAGAAGDTEVKVKKNGQSLLKATISLKRIFRVSNTISEY